MSSKNPHYAAEEEAVERYNKEKLEIIIRPRGFNIIWGNDARYWHLPKKGNKSDPGELAQVSWLEVTGSAKVENGKKYEIGFCITLKADAFGWSGCPVFMMAKLGKKGKYKWIKMKPLDQIETFPAEIPQEKFYFDVPKEGENQLFIGLYEVWTGKWKGGLLIHHAFIREVV